ncbi:hypothetical protein ACFL5O_01570 [Myxococcota bacterium]
MKPLSLLLTLPVQSADGGGGGGSGPQDNIKRYLVLGGAGLGALGLGAVLLLKVVFKDKAQPAWDECVALTAKDQLIQARAACQAAAKADPNSKAGKLAAGKLEALNPLADELEAKNKTAHDAATRPCKAKKYVTRCIYKGKPRPTLLDGSTLAQCNQDAHQLRQTIGMICPSCVCEDDFVDENKGEE